jgi:hypothetical protein
LYIPLFYLIIAGGNFMNRITFFLSSLGFLCIPALHCMENGQETPREFRAYVRKLNQGGPLLIPSKHTNNQQSEEAFSEGIIALLRASVLVGTSASAGNVQPQGMNQPIIISYSENSLKLRQDVKPKPQPAFDYVTMMETDQNPNLFKFAYDQGIVAIPSDYVTQQNAMRRFENARAEKSSTDTDSVMSDESDSDN